MDAGRIGMRTKRRRSMGMGGLIEDRDGGRRGQLFRARGWRGFGSGEETVAVPG